MPEKTILCNFGILQRSISRAPLLPWASIAMFLIVGALVGRAMCGWACPLGFFQDALTSIAGYLGLKQRKLSRKLHYMLTCMKHVVLFATIAIVASAGATYAFSRLLGRRYAFSLGVCGRAPYCLICPAPVLFATMPSLVGTLFSGTPLPELPFTFYIGFFAMVLLVASSLVTKRFWCAYICPLGALMSFFNKFSLLHIKKSGKCSTFCRGHQRDCNKKCPTGIEISRNPEPSSDPECTLCYNCAEACSRNAVKYEVG